MDSALRFEECCCTFPSGGRGRRRGLYFLGNGFTSEVNNGSEYSHTTHTLVYPRFIISNLLIALAFAQNLL